MLPWLLAAITLAAVVLTVPPLGRHLYAVFDDRPQPAWDRWLNPIESALLRRIVGYLARDGISISRDRVRN
jgi:K+-transporting ATPase ATPase A chain